MAVYPSPFGVLNEEGRFDDVVSDESINAELRGLSLLDSILLSTQAWERTACPTTGHTLLVTKTDGYELHIDVVRTVESYLVTGDQHLVVSILKGRNRSVGAVERVCIHHNMNYPDCAIADALISLVLLGESNWPEGATPHTLREFSHAAQRIQIARRFKLGIIELTQEDLDEIRDIREAMQWGIAYAAIDMLCGFARRCYTCKGMEIEDVRLHTQGLFDDIEREDLLAYGANPSTPSDVLFLPEFARPN